MNPDEQNEQDDEMRPEYGPEVFVNGVRGKYYQRYQAGTNLALLELDVRAAFPTDEAVNAALRMILQAQVRTNTVS